MLEANLLLVLAFIWGACWGSFLNVVIYRWPRELSLVRPGSRCGTCETPIRPYDNVPILSYLLLRGRCRACKATFSPRYMLVEAACGLLSLVVFRSFVDVTDPETFANGFPLWLYWQTYVYLLVAITFIDLEHTIVPEVATILGAVTGLAGAFFFPLGLRWDAVIGLAAGAGFLLAVVGVGHLLFRREAMGMGDVLIVGFLGAWLGWRALPFLLLLASIQALLAAGAAQIYTRATGQKNALTLTTQELDERFDEVEKNEGLPPHLAIPFGPFLALSGLEAMLFGTDWFWRLMDAFVSSWLT
ncbi:MAG: prepilin peptidase [Myxococcales bacterium]|nr:prepilin peptidase [Myxococcales bacterium]